MGLLSCRWEAEWNGHQFTMHRNELTKGFSLECDGRELARRRWSLIGTGTLRAEIESNGRSVPLSMRLPLSFGKSRCELSIDGSEVSVRLVR